MLSVPSIHSHLHTDDHWWGTSTRHSHFPVTRTHIWYTPRCKETFAVGERIPGSISACPWGRWCSLMCWRSSLNSILYTHEFLRRQKDPGDTSQHERDLMGGHWSVIEFWPAAHHLDICRVYKAREAEEETGSCCFLGKSMSLVPSISPLQGSTRCATSIFVTLSPLPHRNALPDSL